MTLKDVREAAKEAGKRVKFNRGLGGYQIVYGFISSEIVYPSITDSGRLSLNKKDIYYLFSMI